MRMCVFVSAWQSVPRKFQRLGTSIDTFLFYVRSRPMHLNVCRFIIT